MKALLRVWFHRVSVYDTDLQGRLTLLIMPLSLVAYNVVFFDEAIKRHREAMFTAAVQLLDAGAKPNTNPNTNRI